MATQLNIKDVETVELARRIARRRGTSVTSVIRDALRKEPDATPPEPGPMTPEQQETFDKIMAFVGRLPRNPGQTWAETDAQFQEINAFAYD